MRPNGDLETSAVWQRLIPTNGSDIQRLETDSAENTVDQETGRKLLQATSMTPCPSPSPGVDHRFARHRHPHWRHSPRRRGRIVLKNGEYNLKYHQLSKKGRRFLVDIYTTLVDIQWRWTLLAFALSFILSWLGFAIIWWIICFTHGDLEEKNLNSSEWTPCVNNINSFTSCFLFSIETQHTIGYGSRFTTEQCTEAIIVMCLQSITGVFIQALMVGLVFAKLSRPKKRAQTLMFSKNAVICLRDGCLYLMFRIGDMRESHIISASVRAQLFTKRITREGELLPYYQYQLKVGADSEDGSVFFIWPMTIIHKIDQESPLYHMTASELLMAKFEIVVVLEGCIESTSMTTQARSSYLPNEILWGHRFDPLVRFSPENGEYVIDFSCFNATYEVDTPLCSGKDLEMFQKEHERLQQGESPVQLLPTPSFSPLRRVFSEPSTVSEGPSRPRTPMAPLEMPSTVPETPLMPGTPMAQHKELPQIVRLKEIERKLPVANT